LDYNNGNDKIHTKNGRICTRVDVMLDKCVCVIICMFICIRPIERGGVN